jgi:O-antigen/teichoic acid export membrane protein
MSACTSGPSPALEDVRGIALSMNSMLTESLRARMARGALYSVAAGIATQMGALVSSVLCARLLGADAFGQLGIVRSTVLALSAFAGGGLGVVASRYVAEYRARDRERVGRVLGMVIGAALGASSMIALVAFGMAGPLAGWVSSPELATPLRLGSMLLVTNVVQGVQVGLIVGFERFGALAVIGVVDGMLNAALPAWGAYTCGLDGAVVGYAASGAAGCLVKDTVIRRIAGASGIRMTFRGATRELHGLRAVGVPSALASLITQPAEWLSRLILARRGGAFTEVGIFSAAYSLGQLVTFLPGQISGLVTPMVSNLLGSGDLERAGKVVAASQTVVLLAAVLAGLFMIGVSVPALAAFGSGFTGGSAALVMMALAYIVFSPAQVSRAIFVATDRAWLHAGQTAVWALILVAAAYTWAPLGARGLALAYLVAYAVFTALQLRRQRAVVRTIVTTAPARRGA